MSILSKVLSVVKVVHNPVGAALGLVFKVLMHTLLDEKRIALLMMSAAEKLAASTDTKFDDKWVAESRKLLEDSFK